VRASHTRCRVALASRRSRGTWLARRGRAPAAWLQNPAIGAAPRRAGTRAPMVALALLCAAQFMVILDVTVVTVALPSVQTSLGFSLADLQWVVTAYTLAFGGLLLLGGRAADLLGRRRVFLTGLAIFTAASLSAGLASSQETLLAARALQGLGAALLSPRRCPWSPHSSPTVRSAAGRWPCGGPSGQLAPRSAC
jgi:hypothetical protein